jgi:hypothetical protein
MSVSELCDALPHVLLGDFVLAKDVTLKKDEGRFVLFIKDSIYKKLYDQNNGSKSISFLGCPIASAVACLLAQFSGKTITIKETVVSPDELMTKTIFEIVG